MNQKQTDYQYHNCNFPIKDSVEIIYCDFYGDADDRLAKEWWLHLYQEATEEDMNNLKADKIGEIIIIKNRPSVNHPPPKTHINKPVKPSPLKIVSVIIIT